MRKAKKQDKSLILELLSASFESNQSVNFIIAQDKNRYSRIRDLMAYSLAMCSLFGEVWLSDDDNACALVMYPQLKKTTFKSVLLDLKLIFQAVGIGNVSKVLNREQLIRQRHPKLPIAYLWFLGVKPSMQNQGIGSKLLNNLIDYTETLSLPLYLETSAISNLQWYQKLGFEIYTKLELSYTLYFLKHNRR
jgi:ribosomal protein S18 acetylase RimI-like enzyme